MNNYQTKLQISRPHFPLIGVLSALVMVFAILGAGAFRAGEIIQNIEEDTEVLLQKTALAEKTIDLVNSLSEVAKLGGWTGQLSFENNYEAKIPILKENLNKLREYYVQDNDSLRVINSFIESQQDIINFEYAVFDRARDGNLDQAKKSLYSLEYDRLNLVRTNAIESMRRVIEGDFSQTLMANSKNKDYLRWLVFASLAGAFLVALGLWYVVYKFRKISEELIDRLEQEVEERTQRIRDAMDSQQRSAKLATLGEIASGISHEIVSPLTVVQLTAERIQREARSKDIDLAKLQIMANKIHSMSVRIFKIIKGLKAFSRNDINDPFELYSLRDVIEDAIELCSHHFKLYAIDVRLVVPENIEIRCRPAQLCQIFTNLIVNACDAIESKTNPWIEIKVERIDKQIQILVVDCGDGIPEEVASHLMQPFFSTKSKGKGTGLGLSISNQIAFDHGGSLEYVPNAGHTTFALTLPAV